MLKPVVIRSVEEGFTWEGLLKPKSFFVDEAATEVHILGAFAGSELVGTIVYDWMRIYENRDDKDLYILDTYVQARWQRQGVFTRLFHTMAQRHPGCRVSGHFTNPDVEKMAKRFNKTIGGTPKLVCLNGTYGGSIRQAPHAPVCRQGRAPQSAQSKSRNTWRKAVLAHSPSSVAGHMIALDEVREALNQAICASDGKDEEDGAVELRLPGPQGKKEFQLIIHCRCISARSPLMFQGKALYDCIQQAREEFREWGVKL